MCIRGKEERAQSAEPTLNQQWRRQQNAIVKEIIVENK